jgi:hypothetical protein
MKRHLWGLALTGMLIGVAGCATDPTADISGTPARIVPSYSKLFLFPGDSVNVVVEVRDEQGSSLPIPVTVSSSDASVAAVRADSLPPFEDTRFWVRADGVGGSKITLTAEGISSEVLVSVFPEVFEGNVSVVTSAILDTVVINVAASGLAFVPEGTPTDVLIGGTPTRTVALTADEIRVLPLSIAPVTNATYTVRNMLFLPGTEYEAVIAALDGETTIDVSGEDNEPGNNDPATATPIVVGGPALEGLMSSTDVADIFTFTLSAPASVTITFSFNGGGSDPDIDAYLLDDTVNNWCELDNGCAMATGSQPEETTTDVLPAGTYYIWLDWWAAGASTGNQWYRLRVQ